MEDRKALIVRSEAKPIYVHHKSGGHASVGSASHNLISPGALYNIGNALALFAGAALHVIDVWGQTSLQTALLEYLAGSPEAVWLSLAMLTFIVAGAIYSRAFQSDPRARKRLTQWADLLAGVASVVLTVGLVIIGETIFALAAGFLLAGGKLGSAVLPILRLPREAQIDNVLRKLVIVSRFPSVLALALATYRIAGAGQPIETALLPAIMIFCFLLWLWADLLLLREPRTPHSNFLKSNGD